MILYGHGRKNLCLLSCFPDDPMSGIDRGNASSCAGGVYNACDIHCTCGGSRGVARICDDSIASDPYGTGI
jgi:hypothetical protein